jgi:acetolactate synthase-1/3 small subunit
VEVRRVKKPLHIISFIVENKPGVLFRVAWLIRRRNFNIESISVGPTENANISRMTITLYGDEPTVEQVVKQLRKLVDIIKVSRLDPDNTVIREMALVKVHVPDPAARADLDYYVRAFRGRIVDLSPDAAIVEVTWYTAEDRRLHRADEKLRDKGAREDGCHSTAEKPEGIGAQGFSEAGYKINLEHDESCSI